MDQSRKPCFALTAVTTRGNCCPSVMKTMMFTVKAGKTVPIYITRVPGNYLNSAQESNLIWNSVVIWLQKYKRPAERSFNRAADGSFVGDLGLLWAVNLLEEDPVYANTANLLNLVVQAENRILFCTWMGRPKPLHVESVPEDRVSTTEFLQLLPGSKVSAWLDRSLTSSGYHIQLDNDLHPTACV